MSFSKIAADIRRKQIAQEVVEAILRKKAAGPVTNTLSYHPDTPSSPTTSQRVAPVTNTLSYHPDTPSSPTTSQRVAPVTNTLSYHPDTPDPAQSGRASGQIATLARGLSRSVPTYIPRGPAVRSLLGGKPYQPSNIVLNTLGRAYNQAKPLVDPNAAMLNEAKTLGKGGLGMLGRFINPSAPISPEEQKFRGVVSDYWGPKLNAAKNWLTSRNSGDVLRGLYSGPQAAGRGLRNIFSK